MRKESSSAGVALVTGASSGIGEALVRELHSRGFHVGAVARRSERLAVLAGELEGGPRVLPLPADVSDAEAVQAAVARLENELGPVRLCIANAGISGSHPSWEPGAAQARRTFDVNFFGVLHAFDAVLPSVRDQSGILACVSSVAGWRGLPGTASYCASKAAISTYLESLRVDLHARGVAVVDICPGFVDTAMTQKNSYAMPFMISSERAAALTLRGVLARRARVVYPWQMRLLMQFARALPNSLYDPLVRRSAPKRHPR